MCKMWSVFTAVLFFIHAISCFMDVKIKDEDYMQMPKLFFLDNYDDCMMLGDEALYCTFTFQLQPLYEERDNTIWNIIQNASMDPRYYRHDQLRHGICLPTSCPNSTKEDYTMSTEDIINKCYNYKYQPFDLKGNITKLHCESMVNDYPIDIYDVSFAIFFVLYIMLVIISSIYEGSMRYKSKKEYSRIMETTGGQFVAAFSIPKNWHRLRSINSNPDTVKLRSVQGVRFYNMIGILLCHTIMTDVGGPVSNTRYVENLMKDELNVFVANGNYVVQTFFVISGWLLCFQFFQATEVKKDTGIKYFFLAVINRYIRLTPVLAFIIAFQSTWSIRLGKGPIWHSIVGEEYRNCRQNWWTNLLYVNNYVENNNVCLPHTWYLAADTQLYILSLLLLTFITKKQKYIKVTLGTVLVIGLLVQGSVAFTNNYDILIYPFPEMLYNFEVIKVDPFHDLYSSAYSNICGYTIGLMFGYIFYKYRNHKISINKFHVILWWMLTFGMCLFIIFIAAVMYKPDFQTTALGSAFYWALGKNIFAFGIAIYIFGLTRKIGWFARWACEWRPVQVLGRLTYSTYIVHIALMKIRGGYLRSPIYLNDYILFIKIVGDVTLSYIVGALLCLLFEMPISSLQKMMIPQRTTEKSKELTSENWTKTLESDNCNPILANDDNNVVHV